MNVFEKLNNALLLSALAFSLLLHLFVAMSIMNIKIPEQVTQRDFEKWVKTVQPIRSKGIVLKKVPAPLAHEANEPVPIPKPAKESKVAVNEPAVLPSNKESASPSATPSKSLQASPKEPGQGSNPIRSKLASSGVLGLIGVSGESSGQKGRGTAMANVFSSNSDSFSDDLDSAMKEKRSFAVASGSGFSKSSLKGSSGSLKSTADIDSVGNSSSGKVAVAERKEAELPVARVSSGNSSVTKGSADQLGVLGTLAKKNSSFTRCYEKALKNSPDLSGKLAYQMSVSAEGSVFEVQFIEDTLRSSDVSDCIRSILLRLVFSPPKGGPAIFSSVLVFGTT
ncbi:MAG: AgmX/PglI C-terminal domain-containing protein [Myxococcaceae bacterium]|nr:AgmX/PglI C-terminal domain-containing protein [Myxococcaceae bacterium]MBH2006176.1 AgmX/PglI C-terminal domain-containing protein [Myxococcaceae bacterium]